MQSLFQQVALAPRDPILGLNEAFAADSRSDKINLGVGVYFDENGKIPVLNCLKKAQDAYFKQNLPHAYLPIDGLKTYNLAVQKLLFGNEAELLEQKRVITAQALGGTGALKIGADFLHAINPSSCVFVSNPTWANHRSIFERAGFAVQPYSYYNAQTRGVDFENFKKDLNAMPSLSVVVLHACCHNPTGADLTKPQWNEVVEIFKANNLIAFLDMAYQGFADGIAEDAYALNAFAQSGLRFFVSSSFSKNFSMYGERVGALSVVLNNQDEANRVLSQIKIAIRTNYSNPPTFGAALIAEVLNSLELKQEWEEELKTMRLRIAKIRKNLVASIEAAGCQEDFSFIAAQRGMFSFTGLNKEQVERLKTEFGIYAVSSGRICMAALNPSNVDIVARAIAAVL